MNLEVEAGYDGIGAPPRSGLVQRNVRLAEYKDIAGNTILQHLTQEQQQKMVDLERPRVYAHANEHF